MSSLLLLVPGATVVCLRNYCCLHPNCGRHSWCCWCPFGSWWVTVAGLPAIAGIPGVASVSAVTFKPAVAGGSAVIGVTFLAGGFTYWTVQWDILIDYLTMAIGLLFFLLSDYRIGDFKKLTDLFRFWASIYRTIRYRTQKKLSVAHLWLTVQVHL